MGRGGRVRRCDLDAWLDDSMDLPCTYDDDDELLTLRKATARAEVTRQTIWNWSNDGLKVQRRGRLVWIRASVLDSHLKRHER